MGKKKGKKKKTKEDLERERLEAEAAEEARLAEEERKRQEALELEKERQRQLELERKKQRGGEIRRLGEEAGVFETLEKSQAAEFQRLKAVQAKAAEWDNYLLCTTTPDPNDEADLNSFLSKWRESEDASLVALKEFLEGANLLVDAINQQLAEAQQCVDDKKTTMLLEYRSKTHQLIADNIDAATAHLLSHLDEQKERKAEYIVVIGKESDMTRVGTWINLESAGFRARPIHFVDNSAKIGCSVVIPKSLVLITIALRVIIQANRSVVHDPKPESDGAAVAEQAALLFREWQARTSQKHETYVRNVAGQPCDLLALGYSELPAALKAKYLESARNVFSWKSVIERPPVANVIGGVLSMELIKVPPLCRKVKMWKMRPMGESSKRAIKCTYPLAGTPASQVIQPIQVTLKLPPHVVLPKDLEVGRWDKEKQEWGTDGILDIQFKEEENTVLFSTMHIGHLAVIHRRSSDLPIARWSLVPKEFGVVIFTAETTRFEVQIQITKDGCTLLKPDLPQLRLALKPNMAPRHMLAKLASCNLSLEFTDGDAKRAKLTCRDRTIEKHLYADMAYVCCAFEFSHSRWNQMRPSSDCVFKVQEASDDAMSNGPSVGAESGKASWTMCCRLDTETKRGLKYLLLDLHDDSSEFAFKPAKGEATHATLQACLADEKVSATALSVVEKHDIVLQKNVQYILEAIRPPSFA